jgi:curli production assembly/transport component CsgG/holdfast attachment protein HfaB
MKPLAAGLLATAFFLTGCASQKAAMPAVEPLAGPRAETVTTAYSAALRCLAGHVRSQSYPPPRIAVGLITDMTGAQDRDNGRRLTQGATLMAVTAMSEAGVRLVERYDMGVMQVEMDYTRNGFVRDSDKIVREMRQGEIQGSDLYLVGGISEFNPNIRSHGVDGFAGGTSSNSGSLSLGSGDYVVDVALDLRLVDARSSEILGVRSLRKQIVGREVRAGVFAFLDGTVIDIGGGQRAMEPVQTAVRTMVDQIVFEFIAGLYSFDTETCLPAGQVTKASAGTAARGRLSPVLEGSAVTVAPGAAPPAAPAPTTPPAASRPAPPKPGLVPPDLVPDGGLERPPGEGISAKAAPLRPEPRAILVSATVGPAAPQIMRSPAITGRKPSTHAPGSPGGADAGARETPAAPPALRGRSQDAVALRRPMAE